MKIFRDWQERELRFTDERLEHIESFHPELEGQLDSIKETLEEPDIVVQSKVDPETELSYRFYENTPVTEKYLCVVAKAEIENPFIITTYFTDSIKEGDVLWKKKEK